MSLMSIRYRQWMTALSVILLAACASPRPHFYSLHQPSPVSAVDARPRATVVVGPISIPALVDRPQLVLHENDYEVSVNEQQRWAAPLKDQLMELLAAGLSDRIANRQFVAASSAAINAPAARLSVDFLRLELSRTSGAQLVAHWVYRSASDGSPPIEGNATSHMLPSSNGFPANVDAMRRAVMAVTNDIADALLREQTAL
jgi:uncharacterized lipoprotein YmbA